MPLPHTYSTQVGAPAVHKRIIGLIALLKVVFWAIGGILLVAVLIWLFRKWSSANR